MATGGQRRTQVILICAAIHNSPVVSHMPIHVQQYSACVAAAGHSRLCAVLPRAEEIGFAAERYTFEQRTGRLSDAHISISLQGGMSLRVQHEWFEIAVAALVEGQEAGLADLGKAVLATVAPADDDAQSGNLTVPSHTCGWNRRIQKAT